MMLSKRTSSTQGYTNACSTSSCHFQPVLCIASYSTRLLSAAGPRFVTAMGRTTRPQRSICGIKVVAIDAAQPFDYEHRLRQKKNDESKLKVGIVGFGTFGQFLAKRLVARGHKVIASSRTPYDEIARKIGVEFFQDVDDFCEEHPEVVLLASSILSTESVLRNLPVQRLKRNTLFVDVLSVKVFSKQLLLRELPPEVDILCTHPMFGPDSGKGSWQGLNFMYEKVRIGADLKRERRVENFLKFFREEGCNMVEMTCEEHDRQAASTQFITHTVGRILGTMQLRSTEINTKGFDALLNLVNNTTNDSFELYYGLFLYNQNAPDELERLEKAFDTVKRQLFGRLHDIARAQLFPMDEVLKANDNGNGKGAQQTPALPAARQPLALPSGKEVISASNSTIDV
ncbi:hypothetical protein Vafri_11599 [Volvox africanus]|nr:hypothetical protein Vafri_11599 [Volvox africanus]